MPTDFDAPDTTEFISLGSRLSRWKLTPNRKASRGLRRRQLQGLVDPLFLGIGNRRNAVVGALVVSAHPWLPSTPR